MAKRKVRQAKYVSALSMVTIISVGLIFSVLIHSYSEYISSVLIKDIGTQKLLKNLLELYPFILPFQLLQGGFYGLLRATGKQNYILLAQVISNFIIHYIFLIFLTNTMPLVNNAFLVTFGITYLAMDIYLFIVLLKIDWNQASEDMIKSVGIENVQNDEITADTRSTDRFTCIELEKV